MVTDAVLVVAKFTLALVRSPQSMPPCGAVVGVSGWFSDRLDNLDVNLEELSNRGTTEIPAPAMDDEMSEE